MATSIEHRGDHAAVDKIKALLKKWPLTLFGTAIVFGIAIGVSIGVYISAQVMALRGF
ncbi:hypothetical protein [Selenomonas sp. AB3002]|uniref:hypothetical protein n=1 Tax=Selenomonas sp. AB3002 TaxID=1392502 RepID=UPI00163A96B1